jgi:hypothetical protein
VITSLVLDLVVSGRDMHALLVSSGLRPPESMPAPAMVPAGGDGGDGGEVSAPAPPARPQRIDPLSYVGQACTFPFWLGGGFSCDLCTPQPPSLKLRALLA